MKQYLINSPINKAVTNGNNSLLNSKDAKAFPEAEKTNLGAVPIYSPKFGQKKGEKVAAELLPDSNRNMKLEMSKISQEDI
jgi:hypothetical protein